MKFSFSKLFTALFLGLLAVYGLASTVFTARELGDTFDEATYREGGFAYLSRLDFRNNRDHPPLSKWLSSLYPYLSGDHSIFAFRVTHTVLFLLGGLAISILLFKKRSRIAALTFAAFYFLCPNLKAMASLHVNDFDVSLFIALTAICVWQAALANHAVREVRRWTFAAFFFLGCACTCKVSAFFYLPFAIIALNWGRRKISIGAAGGFVLAIVVAYLFYIPGIRWFGSSLVYQLHHNMAGHPSFFLGRSSWTGYWDFFLVLFFLKLPLATLVLVLVGNLRLLWKYTRFPLETFIFIAPAGALFLILTFGKIHIGFRYFLPGLILLYLSAAFGIDDLIARARRRLREFPTLSSLTYGGWAVGLIAMFFVDLSTVRADTYLSFFNTLSPNPTRNFADSNIDWGQGIPPHLKARLPAFQYAKDFSFAKAFEENSPDFYLAVGASHLWKLFPDYDGSWLLQHMPVTSASGVELHEFSALSLFDYLEGLEARQEVTCRDLRVQKDTQKSLTVRLEQGRSYFLVKPGVLPSPVTVGENPGDFDLAPGALLASATCTK
jgi:hypothetical protein